MMFFKMSIYARSGRVGRVTQVMPLRPPKTQSHRSLPYDQVPAALDAVRASDAWIGTRLLMEFLALTAVRTNEARRALWSEIDFERAQWTIPADRMKEREQHSVPLSSAALAVLRGARDHPNLDAARRGSQPQ